MTKLTKIPPELMDKFSTRIRESNISEAEKTTLLDKLKENNNKRTTEYSKNIHDFFKPYTNSDGLISNPKLSSQDIKKIQLTEQQKQTLSIIQQKIKKKKQELSLPKVESTPSLDKFTMEKDNYSSNSLNKYNYSDFLEGKLDKHIRPKITMIVAYDSEYGIGLNGTLPWHIPADLKFFKEYTEGKAVVMGSTNYTDISKVTKGKGLPNRRNIVLSSKEHDAPNFEFFKSIEDILVALENEKEIIIIGGTMLYETFLPIADEIIATEINKKFETDVKFPHFKDKFACVSENNLTLDTKKSFKDTTITPAEVSFRRYFRIEPPSYEGISHVKGEAKPYNYTNVPWTHNNYFIADTLMYVPLDLLNYVLLEIIFNNPLPVLVLETLVDTGNLLIDSTSIVSWIPDFYAGFMANPESSILDFFDLSNIDFSFLGDIGEFIADVIGGIFKIIGEILGGLIG
ncbi:TPA: dihydrofolate reductase [Escherichia coli]|nr:dihydrofolate reductase [Escherichia coli]